MPPKKQHALASRVKRIMQADEDVGKIAQATPVLIGERERKWGGESGARKRAGEHARDTSAPACLRARAEEPETLD